MGYEVHIWGPAFGAPSIDAQCLATVAYLKQCLPRDAWVLIPTSDPALNPLGQLPALKDGSVWIGGYHDIVAYLHTSSAGEYTLSKGLTASQQADCTAYASFIESRAQPILDLTLYVSSENYHQCTKPALASILTWPNNWFVPHKLRERAKKRSAHLGLQSLDLDLDTTAAAAAQDEGKKDDQGLAAQIPKSLRKPKKQTISSILGRDTIKRHRFRLDAVAADLLEPLEDMLGGKKWLVSESEMTSADCLALAYLTLLRGPSDLPHSWVWDRVRNKHADLEGWVLEKRAACFGPPVSSSTYLSADAEGESEGLPWQAPSARNWHDVVNATVLNIANASVGLGSYLNKGELLVQLPDSSTTSLPSLEKEGQQQQQQQQLKQTAVTQIQSQRLFYSQLFGSSLFTAIVTGLLFWNGVLSLPKRPFRSPGPRVRTFGEAGALLGLH